ncbi:hypothetical protein B0H34DRAFT_783758 [Crassisporium funariophilum]|nr:hypothetical protein B0H34DRAFT_783758 [Crassisporium funariophilum]
MERQERAAAVLKFVVVGGGISGLATSYRLRKAGHDVILLEGSDGSSRSTGGLRSPPNMTRLLNQWGLGPMLEHTTQECQGIKFLSGTSGDFIGSMIVDEDFLRDLVAGFLFMQHGDLQSMIYDLAEQEGVVFRFNTRVVDADPETGSVLLHTGERLFGDVIVGADGYDSILRPFVTGVPDTPSDEKHLILTFIVNADLLRADDDLRDLTDPKEWSFWLGDGYLVHANILNGGRDYTVTVAHDYDQPLQKGDDDWREQCPIERYGIDFTKFESRTRKLLSFATVVSSRVFMTRPSLESLVCEQSRIVLVGEAAHPLLPGGHHCTALALEDAQTLGYLFSRIQHRNQVSRLLTAYDEIRQPRCADTKAYDYSHQAMLKTRTGPIQERRDAQMRKTLVHKVGERMDEVTFKKVWGNELILFALDATEKVDDWWGQWGSLIVRSPPDRSSVMPSVEISVVKDNDSIGVAS